MCDNLLMCDLLLWSSRSLMRRGANTHPPSIQKYACPMVQTQHARTKGTRDNPLHIDLFWAFSTEAFSTALPIKGAVIMDDLKGDMASIVHAHSHRQHIISLGAWPDTFTVSQSYKRTDVQSHCPRFSVCTVQTCGRCETKIQGG